MGNHPKVREHAVNVSPAIPLFSVIIPTRDRPERLAACLAGLARQEAVSSRIEVLVVPDGYDPAAAAVVQAAQRDLPVRLLPTDRLGPAHAKNLGLAEARGELILLLNDDVIPEPGLLSAHARAHQSGAPALVLGWSPWIVEQPDRLFDRLIRETSMVFFYDRMISPQGRPVAQPGHDWGFRHAWTLNLSFRREHALRIGGFRPCLANCCYEDVEFGFRFTEEFQAPVLFEPAAVAHHHHRYEPAGYLQREFRLGYSAHGLAVAAPRCARAIFGSDLLRPANLDYCREYAANEARSEQAQNAAFAHLASIPASAIDGPHRDELLALLYTQHLPLKRLAFRRGLLAALENQRFDGLFHPEDGLETQPGLLPVGLVGAP